MIIYCVGTPHGAEVIPLFGYPFLEDNPEALQHSGWPPAFVRSLNFTQNDKDYSDFLLTLWTNFAKYRYVHSLSAYKT